MIFVFKHSYIMYHGQMTYHFWGLQKCENVRCVFLRFLSLLRSIHNSQLNDRDLGFLQDFIKNSPLCIDRKSLLGDNLRHNQPVECPTERIVSRISSWCYCCLVVVTARLLLPPSYSSRIRMGSLYCS